MKAPWGLRYTPTAWFLLTWLLVGLGLSVMTFCLLWSKQVDAQKADLNSRCKNAAAVLQGELFSSVYSFGMYNGLVHAFPNISTPDFENFAGFTNYLLPFCEGIAYLRYITGPQRTSSESELGTSFTQFVPPGFAARIPTFTLRANASEYTIVWRMTNHAYQAFYSGFDLMSDPQGLSLVTAARDSGKPVVSGPIKTLDGSTAVSVLWPVYTLNPFMHRSVGALRANFQGLVMALFDIQNLFDAFVAQFTLPSTTAVRIYDTTNTTDPMHQGSLFYNATKGTKRPMPHGKEFLTVLPQSFGGRNYRLECRMVVPIGDLLSDSLPWGCLLLLFFILVAFLAYLVTRRFRRDKEAVQRVEKLNMQLDAARVTAESADRAKSSFLAMMSHELRTPMTGTLGMLDLLRLTPMTEEQCLYVTTMQSSAESLLACLNDILDFSKIEAGQLRLEEIDFDIADLVQQVTTLFSGKLQGKGLRIDSQLPTAEECKARGDPLRLQQILTNLISNAIKFTEKGRITIHWRRLSGAQLAFEGRQRSSFSSFRADAVVNIDLPEDVQNDVDQSGGCLTSMLRRRRPNTLARVSSSLDDGKASPSGSEDSKERPHADALWYEFSVSDTGIGMPDEVQQKLFRSFVQADDSTTRVFGGTGLGLVICKKLLTAMGGSISVHSELNVGSTFTCVVPLRPQETNSRSAAHCSPDGSPHLDRLSTLSSQLFPSPKTSSHFDATPSRPRTWEPVQEAQSSVQVSQTAHFTDSQTAPSLEHSKDDSSTLMSADTERTVEGEVSREFFRSIPGAEKGHNVSDGSELPSTPELLRETVRTDGEESAGVLRMQGGWTSQSGDTSSKSTTSAAARFKEKAQAPLVGATASSETIKEPGLQAHILVAEDNLVNQMLIKRMLKRFGHGVDVVGNGALAVEAVKAKDYALCLMDLQMPVLDGISATEQIRQLDPPKCDVPIYVLSADVLAQNKIKQDLKLSGYLTKPIKWDVLLAAIEDKLKLRGM